jgi:hypothetical protein
MQAVAVIEHLNVLEDCSTSLMACSEVLVIDQFIFPKEIREKQVNS